MPLPLLRSFIPLLAALALAANLLVANAAAAPRADRHTSDRELVVQPSSNRPIEAIAARLRLEVVEHQRESNTFLLRAPDRASAQQALAILVDDASVEFAEPNTALAIPLAQIGIPGIDQIGLPGIDQIGLPGIDQIGLPGVDARGRLQLDRSLRSWREQPAFKLVGVSAANRVATGQDVTVAILDTGVEQRHPLFAWLWSSILSETGYHGGWAGGEIDLVVGKPAPANRTHGTFVAGLVAGVAPGATLLSVRVADANGKAPAFRVAAGITAAVRAGANVVNLSMSTPDKLPRVVREAIVRANAAGVLVVASAGNEGVAAAGYPAQDAYGVGASNLRDRRAQFSNYGEGVAIGAPGLDVYSLYVAPDGRTGTATWSGTSFAAALVSGGAAVVAERTNLDPVAVAPLIEQSAQSLPSASRLGAGRLDLAEAVAR